MPRSDPFRALRLLRRIELENARRRFADGLRVEAQAVEAYEAAVASLKVEAASSSASDYAAWLPVAMASTVQTATAHLSASAAIEPLRQAMADAARAEQIVTDAYFDHKKNTRDEKMRKFQIFLDDL